MKKEQALSSNLLNELVDLSLEQSSNPCVSSEGDTQSNNSKEEISATDSAFGLDEHYTKLGKQQHLHLLECTCSN
jgi:hypothetical protein